MASLKIKTGHRTEVDTGYVEIEGQCVMLRQGFSKDNSVLEFAYCLMPGETVTRVDEGDYIVEF